MPCGRRARHSPAATEPAEVDACFLESIVPMAEQATRESLAMLRVMGVVGSPALRSAATAAAAARGVGEQRWVAKIGNPSIGDCWVYRDDVGARSRWRSASATAGGATPSSC